MEDRDIIALGDRNYVEALREQARACGGVVVERDGLVLTMGSGPHPVLNNAVRADPARDAGDCLAEISAFYGEAGYGFTVVGTVGNDDRDLVEAARSSGLTPLLSPPSMVCDELVARPDLPSGFEIREVNSDRDIEDYRKVSQEAWATYGVPPEVPAAVFRGADMLVGGHVRAVLGCIEGSAVSAALALFSHGIAGLYWVGTVPSARGKGLGGACTRSLTNTSFELGARKVILQASPMGDPIYRSMGYRQVGAYELLAALPSR